MIDRTELTQEQKDEIIAQALTFDGMGRMYPPEFCPPPPIIPYSAREDCSSCCDKKSCCEPSDSKTQIPINDAEMYWDLHPVEVTDIPDGREPVGNDKVVAIEWGWSAGMTDDELTQIAEDAPSWKYSVKTTLPMAEEFYNRLGELIKKMKG